MRDVAKKETPKKVLAYSEATLSGVFNITHRMENDNVTDKNKLIPERLSKLLYKLESFGLTVDKIITTRGGFYSFRFNANSNESYNKSTIKRLIDYLKTKDFALVSFNEVLDRKVGYGSEKNDRYMFIMYTEFYGPFGDVALRPLFKFYKLTDELKEFNRCIDRLREELNDEARRANSKSIRKEAKTKEKIKKEKSKEAKKKDTKSSRKEDKKKDIKKDAKKNGKKVVFANNSKCLK